MILSVLILLLSSCCQHTYRGRMAWQNIMTLGASVVRTLSPQLLNTYLNINQRWVYGDFLVLTQGKREEALEMGCIL